MFTNLKNFFLGSGSLEYDAQGVVSDTQLKIAVAALLVEVLQTDGQSHALEIEKVHKILSRSFDITEEAAEIIALLASDRSAGSRIPEYLKLVREKFSVAQRKEIIKDVEKIALIDGELSGGEALSADLMAMHLGVTVGDE
jgi:uncharacterized tellurite resistance protein B-like protein